MNKSPELPKDSLDRDSKIEQKKKEDKILSWFLTSGTVIAVIIALYLSNNRPSNGWGNHAKKTKAIEINCNDCKKRILELTKENDSLRQIILSK